MIVLYTRANGEEWRKEWRGTEKKEEKERSQEEKGEKEEERGKKEEET
jgi:hypothetical protein